MASWNQPWSWVFVPCLSLARNTAAVSCGAVAIENFWPATVELEGIIFPTAEHAYQAAKSLDSEQRRRIAALPTPADAKREGRKLKLRDDWETAKFEVMEHVVRYKFTHHAELREKLLATGDAMLEEGNDWGDQIWGTVNGVGENRLGKILMKVRAELREGATTQPSH